MIDSSASSPLSETGDYQRSYGSINSSYLLLRSKADSSVFTHLATRLRFRNDLHYTRRATALFSLIFGFTGLGLAILEIELSIVNSFPVVNNRFSFISFILKSLITVTTLILLCLIVFYHHIDLKIQTQRYNTVDQKLVLNCNRILQLIMEIIVCSLHPPLGINGPIFATKKNNYILKSIDGTMTILMFLRIYLLARVLVLWSSLHQDTLAQSFGAINQTSVNTSFIFKSWINLYAGYVLIILMLLVVFWGGWSLRVCEMYSGPYFLTFSNSFWLTGVTFLTIGYGDIIPQTVCAKFVAVFIGALGAGITALVVAIVASKLELTQSEKYLHHFVQDSHLNQNLREVSANIIKFSWKLHKYRKSVDKNSKMKKISSIYFQRQLLFNVRLIKQIRAEKRQLSDSSVSILEVNRAQSDSHNLLEDLNDKVVNIEKALLKISSELEKKIKC